MNIVYPAIKEEGKPFRVVNLKAFNFEVNELKKGHYRITVDKWRRKASPPQFGWLYGAIYPLTLKTLNDAGYEFTNIDQVDIFWKTLFANKDLLIRETGEIRKVPMSKSEFLTIDHMAFVSNIRTYCQEYLNTYIPEPDIDWKKHREEMQKLIDNAKL